MSPPAREHVIRADTTLIAAQATSPPDDTHDFVAIRLHAYQRHMIYISRCRARCHARYLIATMMPPHFSFRLSLRLRYFPAYFRRDVFRRHGFADEALYFIFIDIYLYIFFSIYCRHVMLMLISPLSFRYFAAAALADYGCCR